MISALFKREMKSGYKLLLIFMAVLSLYVSMIIAMFDPKLGDSLKAMAESMPDLFAAFGMNDVGNTLIEFVANYLYGFLLIAFPIVFIILMSSRLMAKYIDRGSMAYLLSSPHKRVAVVATQAVSMITFLILLAGFVTALGLMLSHFMFEGELDINSFLLLNLGWLTLLIFLSGLCFCSTCVFTDTKFSLGVGGGLCILFILIQMVSQVDDKFEWLKYINPLTLFDLKELSLGNAEALLPCISLLFGGILLYIAGGIVFSKRDLSI